MEIPLTSGRREGASTDFISLCKIKLASFSMFNRIVMNDCNDNM